MNDEKFKSMANAFYGESKPDPSAQAAAPKMRPAVEDPTVIYDKSQPAQKEEPIPTLSLEPKDADHFYSEGATRKGGIYDVALRPGLNDLRDHLGFTAEGAEQVRAARAQYYYMLNFSPSEVPEMDARINRYTINPADDETRKQWGIETRRALRERYGDEADKLLADAREFCKEAGMSAELDRSGLGNNPDFILDLIPRVQRCRRDW